MTVTAEPAVSILVLVRDLTVQALIGVNPDEQGRRQPLIVSVEAALDATGRFSHLGETVNYCDIVTEAHRIAAHHVGLIEEYARLLGERCLTLGPVEQVTVTVAKPEALGQGMAATIVRVARPAPANILPFPSSGQNGGRQRAIRFAFQADINPDAQRKLAGFLRSLADSIRGVELGALSFDRQAGEWVARITLGERWAPRVEAGEPPAGIHPRPPLKEVK